MGGNLTGNLVERNYMVVRKTQWLGASLAIATLLAGAQAVHAQEVQSELRSQRYQDEYPTVQDEILDTFFTNSGDFYRNTGFLGTVTTFLGPFPENNIARDADATIELVQELQEIQSTSDPTIRTVDLDNPFGTSLLLLPPYEAPVPSPRPAYIPPIQGPASSPPPPARGPVRGLY
ncbi:hypothetical protein [Leptolyngbya sp. FACHB-16]|uniref:hypothetical protein n=2 Tax=unclassified Leptolyngbya TaxID=2650499 RepID=UPI0016825247|nr:hypothetical protein [Leptolyngbya sp. FACHB-16]MBD2157246.1 hypothetical protein [Leptolyngbya sp. FACHB-16]